MGSCLSSAQYIHKSWVCPADYRYRSNKWALPQVLSSSCHPLSQSALDWVATASGHLMRHRRKPQQPFNQKNSYKRKVPVSEHPSVILDPLPVVWDSPGSSLKNLPTDTEGVFPSQGPCCNLADWPDNVAFDPLRSNIEGHCAVEVTTLSWKPEKSLTTSAFLSFILRSDIPSQPFPAFLSLTTCGISRKCSKVGLTCSFKGTKVQ